MYLVGGPPRRMFRTSMFKLVLLQPCQAAKLTFPAIQSSPHVFE
jgi:hypothetical protein